MGHGDAEKIPVNKSLTSSVLSTAVVHGAQDILCSLHLFPIGPHSRKYNPVLRFPWLVGKTLPFHCHPTAPEVFWWTAGRSWNLAMAHAVMKHAKTNLANLITLLKVSPCSLRSLWVIMRYIISEELTSCAFCGTNYSKQVCSSESGRSTKASDNFWHQWYFTNNHKKVKGPPSGCCVAFDHTLGMSMI